jgi:hypothetical protein
MSLKDLARHGCVEHNASLAHGDAIDGKEYAPTSVDESYLRLLFGDSKDGVGLTAEDIAKARVRRESAYSQPLDGVHAEIGEQLFQSSSESLLSGTLGRIAVIKMNMMLMLIFFSSQPAERWLWCLICLALKKRGGNMKYLSTY